ncbi:bacterial Ig-like domain family protein [Burkholderia pseudomallei]|nr:bacterial Ig-like domain family protein [Burkholderia pseudomallei]CAK0457993.1 bacterial Ig-like domain family protein [Burkholderia pseudomallei]
MHCSSLVSVRIRSLLAVCGLIVHQSHIGVVLQLAIWVVFVLSGISVAVAKDASRCGDTDACRQQAASQNGQAVAASLNTRYLYMVNQCPDGKPAYYCSGIAVRATDAANGQYHEWDPSPNSLQMGSVSFSYIRADTGTASVYHDHGFIFKNNADFDSSTYPGLSYRCIYPNDAATDDNVYLSFGCMKHPPSSDPRYTGDVSSCGPYGVKTADEWIQMKQKNNALGYNCSFSTEDPVAFYQALQAAYEYKINENSLWTELLATTWPDGVPGSLPIEAFFYTSQYKHGSTAGLQNAQAVQVDFCKATGKFKPIVKLDFTAVDMNIFSYRDADQAATCAW